MSQNSITVKGAWNPRSDRKANIVWMALVWVAVLSGFGLDLTRYMAETPPPPLVLHLHGAVYVLWLVLVSTQIFLIEAGHVALHKQLGWAVAVLSATLVPLGVVAALVDQARQVTHPDYAPQFLALEFEDMVGFTIFIIAGLLRRRDLAAHKRLMILSAVSLTDAGFGRLWSNGVKTVIPGPFGWWLEYYWGIALLLIAMAAWDLWRRKRIHPTVLFGAAVLWGGEIIATILNFSMGFRSAMVALVTAWGFAG